jgi:dolichol kinase
MPSQPAIEPVPVPAVGAPSATRKDLQIGRRLVHLANGSAVATAYAFLFTHQQVVYLFGTIACVVYILDRIRIHYPELLQRLPWMNRLFFRAEEEVKEAAMTPYVIAILLTLLTFPKVIALIAIYTLAIADPLSAMVGITWGRRHIVPEKTVEGSAAFLTAAFLIAFAVLTGATSTPAALRVGTSLLIATAGALFEMLPLRLDDNLTIPLFVGFAAWIACGLTGLPLG